MTTRNKTPSAEQLFENLNQLTANDVVHDVLEDFDVIATPQLAALVRNRPNFTEFRQNVKAAIVASTLGLTSLDHAKRRYCAGEEASSDEELAPMRAYVGVYQFVKAHIEALMTSLITKDRPQPSAGVYGASIVLERLRPSFFCAHLMYQLGHRYEGHAISRLILEQIAWAFEACEARDIDSVEAIRTTAAISTLKRFAPDAGVLYGFLSKKTHIDYSSHREFLKFQHGQTTIVHGHDEMHEYASTMLRLGDLFGLIWEASQFSYLRSPVAVELRNGVLCPNPARPYLAEMEQRLALTARAAADRHR
jgi:hypothetical protein